MRGVYKRVSTALAVRQGIAGTFVEQKGARQKSWTAHGFKEIVEQTLGKVARFDRREPLSFGKGEPGSIVFILPLVSSEFGKGEVPNDKRHSGGFW